MKKGNLPFGNDVLVYLPLGSEIEKIAVGCAIKAILEENELSVRITVLTFEDSYPPDTGQLYQVRGVSISVPNENATFAQFVGGILNLEENRSLLSWILSIEFEKEIPELIEDWERISSSINQDLINGESCVSEQQQKAFFEVLNALAKFLNAQSST
ncbi:MAG TPA: hypothetical protein PKA63_13010 [Oligoflexia bacterium]|nr:hypothetical protein [Oligoflexia bacterium]HMP49579.1 hypothetical protein [Oligoflexia bacterium]